MIKKGLLLVAAALVMAPAAMAANYTSAGCGLGSILFDNKNTKVHLVLAATTNGTFGNQTFGISSDTLGCSSSGVVKNDKQTEVYAAVNLQKLSQEMAQGGGEYLTGLSKLMGVQDAQRAAFFKLTQKSYEKLFPTPKTDARDMLAVLRSEMSQDPSLRTL